MKEHAEGSAGFPRQSHNFEAGLSKSTESYFPSEAGIGVGDAHVEVDFDVAAQSGS